MRPARPPRGQEGEHLRFSPSCQSTPFPSGRAARAKVSPALPLQPGLSDKVSKISATPEGAGAHGAPDGTRSERRLRANSGHKPNVVSTPAFRGERKRKLPRRYRKSNFPQNVENLFAVAGTRERLPAGVIDKRGLRPPLARPRRAGATFPPPAGGDPPLEAGTSVRLVRRIPQNRTVEFISHLKSGNTCLDLLCRAW